MGVERILRARDIIMIGARNGIETGMKTRFDLPYTVNDNVVGKKRIHLMGKPFRIGDFFVKVEMGIIVPRMNARVGAPTARNLHFFTEFKAQTTFNRSLHGWRVGLDLVTVVAAPVVGHMDEITRHHWDLSRKNM